MGNEAHFDAYMSVDQKKALINLSKKTGISASQLLLTGLSYWLSHEKELKREAELFKDLMRERELKEKERDLGDYVGSFEKKEEKLLKYYQLKKQGKITDTEYREYIKQTNEHFEGTQRIKRKRFGTSTKQDKLKEFAEKHGCKVTKDGKLEKKKQR